MKIFHHNDLDGRCSAFQVVDYYGGLKVADVIEMGYNTVFPLETIKPGELVVIVDYSIAPEIMRELLKVTDDVIWIDHHASAIKKYENFGAVIPGLRDTAACGAVLTYIFYKGLCQPGNSVQSIVEHLYEDPEFPEYIKLTNDHDLWKFKFGNRTKAFQLYMDTFHNTGWFPAFNSCKTQEGLNKLVTKGILNLEYKTITNRSKALRRSFYLQFEGIDFLAINNDGNADVFDTVKLPEYEDAYMVFSMEKDRKFKVSMFTDRKDLDLLAIAVKHGGGGHPTACGFYTDNIYDIIGYPESNS